jgi:hypothetical protein
MMTFRGKERRFKIFGLSSEAVVEWMNWCNAQPNRYWLVPQFEGVTPQSEILDVQWSQSLLGFSVLVFDPGFPLLPEGCEVPYEMNWSGVGLRRIDFPEPADFFGQDVVLPFEDEAAGVVLTRE